MKAAIAQFIPIVLFVLLLTHFKSFILFSHTVLGKFVGICIIMFYAYVDKTLGLFVCALIIFYYQTDYVDRLMSYYMPKEMVTIAALTEEEKIQQFRKENCSNNTLKFKGIKVRNEMVEHVFPKVAFLNNSCNPCDTTCRMRMKLDTEEKLRESFDSSDYAQELYRIEARLNANSNANTERILAQMQKNQVQIYTGFEKMANNFLKIL